MNEYQYIRAEGERCIFIKQTRFLNLSMKRAKKTFLSFIHSSGRKK